MLCAPQACRAAPGPPPQSLHAGRPGVPIQCKPSPVQHAESMSTLLHTQTGQWGLLTCAAVHHLRQARRLVHCPVVSDLHG